MDGSGSPPCLLSAFQCKYDSLHYTGIALTEFSIKFEFRVAASMEKKPMTAHQRRVSNAFADTNPDFDLGKIGLNHKLILNKFCVVRPQFVLPTITFEPQSDPLNKADLGALSEVLRRLDGDYVAIFNCGAEA